MRTSASVRSDIKISTNHIELNQPPSRNASVRDNYMEHPAATKRPTAYGQICHPYNRPVNLRLRGFSWTDRLPFWHDQTPLLTIVILAVLITLQASAMAVN